MKITEKSEIEREMEGLLSDCLGVIGSNCFRVSDANKIVANGGRLLLKCEELRKSRDKWRWKYENK